MNAPLGTKDRPWKARVSLINGEASSTITAGEPVVLNTSNLGQVVLPATAGATLAHPLFAGIAASSAAIGQPVEIVGGYVHKAKYVLWSRAASTDSYASVASVALGVYCTINTVHNGIASSGAGAASAAAPDIVLLETIASIASAASTTSNALLASTSHVKVWVRALT